ncbi:MAG: hypothetical protein RL189_1193 [Pseudomonadota bacterium]
MKKKKAGRLGFHAWYLGLFIVLFFFIASIFRIRDYSESGDGQVTGFFENTERIIFDYRIRSRGERAMTGKVGILAIDEKSIDKFGRWPFSRSSYHEAFANLKKAGVQWIALDAIYPEGEDISLNNALEPMQDILQKSLSPAGVLDPRTFVQGIAGLLKQSPTDQSFGDAIADFANIVQAFVLLPPENAENLDRDWKTARQALEKNLVSIVTRLDRDENRSRGELFPLVNIPLISGSNPIIGFINNTPDIDGLMRRYKLILEVPANDGENINDEKRFIPSLGLQLVAKYLNRKIRVDYDQYVRKILLVGDSDDAIEIPLNGQSGYMLLNHYGEYSDSNNQMTPVVISLADAAENKLPQKMPEILILGSTTIGADDKRPSPLNSSANGVEHHVAMVENVLRSDFLIRPIHFLLNETVLVLIAGLVLCLLLVKAGALLTLMITAAAHLTIELIDRKLIFGTNQLYNFGILHIQNATIFISMTMFKYFVEEREKRQIKGAFQHYLNPSVINQLLESPDGLKLGGEKRELTVFFSDVRGFTTISEILSPEALASLLNEYFTPMTNIVLESKGLLDKYIGDALMAVWGAPLPLPDHADRALESALRMLDALDHLREGWKSRNLPAIDIGCGINTGPMVVGNMGSNLRFDYTVLGDSVNLGSRLEGITKEYGVRIICSGSTKDSLKNPERFVLRELDWIKVKGKNEPVTIYEVMRFPTAEREKIMKVREFFESGLGKYRQRKFSEAQSDFMQALQLVPQDGPSSTFLERCEYFIENPVHEGWEGIWIMKSK